MGSGLSPPHRISVLPQQTPYPAESGSAALRRIIGPEQLPKGVHYSRKWMEEIMSQRTFSLVVGVVFLLIAVGHLVRIVLGATFVIEGVAIPMWPSVLAAMVMAYLAGEGFRLSKKPKSGP